MHKTFMLLALSILTDPVFAETVLAEPDHNTGRQAEMKRTYQDSFKRYQTRSEKPASEDPRYLKLLITTDIDKKIMTVKA